MRFTPLPGALSIRAKGRSRFRPPPHLPGNSVSKEQNTQSRKWTHCVQKWTHGGCLGHEKHSHRSRKWTHGSSSLSPFSGLLLRYTRRSLGFRSSDLPLLPLKNALKSARGPTTQNCRPRIFVRPSYEPTSEVACCNPACGNHHSEPFSAHWNQTDTQVRFGYAGVPMICNCPTCGQPLPEDPVERQADAIRAWCNDNQVPILLGDCLRRSDVAVYMGRKEKTLANWKGSDGLQPSRYLNGRPYYEIREIAAYITSR